MAAKKKTLYQAESAFTLIELSVVLVVIGLIVGGIMVGRSLLAAATLRAQIAQIERYQTAVHTFRGKYNNYLPGDIPNPDAQNFGFVARGTAPGEGDGNGILEGVENFNSTSNSGIRQAGETLVFWRDLSTARLIEDRLSRANMVTLVQPAGAGSAGSTQNSSPPITDYLPSAKYGKNFLIYIISTSPGAQEAGHVSAGTAIRNYFVLARAHTIEYGYSVNAAADMPVRDAHAIDAKIDDGLPTTGVVNASFVTNSYFGSNGMSAATEDDTTCYGSTSRAYSLGINNGSGLNCALSIHMK